MLQNQDVELIAYCSAPYDGALFRVGAYHLKKVAVHEVADFAQFLIGYSLIGALKDVFHILRHIVSVGILISVIGSIVSIVLSLARLF